jgi:hypothetical protein
MPSHFTLQYLINYWAKKGHKHEKQNDITFDGTYFYMFFA